MHIDFEGPCENVTGRFEVLKNCEDAESVLILWAREFCTLFHYAWTDVQEALTHNPHYINFTLLDADSYSWLGVVKL